MNIVSHGQTLPQRNIFAVTASHPAHLPHKILLLRLLASHGLSYVSMEMFHTSYSTSLSTLVLNSRDWSEIVWLPEILRFKIDLAISFIRKNPLECIG